MEERVGHRIAYRPEEELHAEEIRARCIAGIQGPVIVAPEALNGSLFPALKSAARAGWLRHFVIDEAHMVLSWGDEFRPAFQQLAAARREFAHLAAAERKPGFITLLLSATLTDYHLRWLRPLFSDGNHFIVLHATRLRPEPAFWRHTRPRRVSASSGFGTRSFICRDQRSSTPRDVTIAAVGAICCTHGGFVGSR